MKNSILYLIIMAVLGCVASIALASPSLDKTEIRDIRTQLPPNGLPPFTGSAMMLLVVGIGLAVTAKSHTERSARVRQPAAPPATDTLSLLSEAYERGELPSVIVCERLAGLIGARLVPGASMTMTSTEVLASACEAFSDDAITAATSLLDLCDRVRFGAFHPDTKVVAMALAETQLLVDRLPGTVQ